MLEFLISSKIDRQKWSIQSRVIALITALFNPSLAEHDMPCQYNVDLDQLASEEANRSESALIVIKYENFYQNPGSSNLIGWKLEVGMAS